MEMEVALREMVARLSLLGYGALVVLGVILLLLLAREWALSRERERDV